MKSVEKIFFNSKGEEIKQISTTKNLTNEIDTCRKK